MALTPGSALDCRSGPPPEVMTMGRTAWFTACASVAAQVMLVASISTTASATALASHPVVDAVRRGDCDAAIDLVKRGIISSDSQAALLGGRMLDEGVCVVPNAESAARLFQFGAKLGDREAALEYAAKVGLGQGAEQSYEHAGELCRSAGFDPQARLSAYSLGYACTLRSVAGRLLRVTLPARAFLPGTGTVVVEFTASDSTIRVLSMPHVERESDAATGSHLGKPRVNAQRAIDTAWRNALAAVPAPDASRLQNLPMELSLDAETVLENGAPEHSASDAPFRDAPPTYWFGGVGVPSSRSGTSH
jgi:hypothetical protein